MKKSIHFIFFLLTFCTHFEIHGKEVPQRTLDSLSGGVAIHYDFTNNFTGNINLGFHQKKWDVYLDYSGHSDRIEISSALHRTLHDTPSNSTSQTIETEQHHISHLLNFQLNLRPTPKNTFLWTFNIRLPRITTHQDINDNARNRIAFSRETFESGLAYKHSFEKDSHEWSVNGLFSFTRDARPATYHEQDVLHHTADGSEKPRLIHLQADYLNTLPNLVRLEAHVSYFTRRNKMNYHFYNTNNDKREFIAALSSELDHEENILSTRIAYSSQPAKRLSYQLGLHAEYNVTRLKYPTNNQKQTTNRLYPYPFLTLNYTLTDRQEIAFHFTRAATRPDYTQLNPYKNYIAPATFEQGNPTLKPEITNRSEINYSFTGEKFQVHASLYFNAMKKFISPIYTLPEPTTLLLTYTNGNVQNNVGLDVNLPYDPFPWLNLTPSFSIYHTRFSGKREDINLRTSALCWTSDLALTITPLPYTVFQAYYSYRSPTTIPQFKVKGNHYLDLSVR